MQRLGAIAGIVGPMVFVLVVLAEGATRAGYSAIADYVSALALGDRGWIQIANFLFAGMCLLLFAGAVRQAFPDGAASRAGPIILALLGLAYLLSGPFVMDPAGTAPGAMSTHGLLHGILGALVFVLMPVAPLVFVRRFRRDPQLSQLFWPTLLLGIFTLVADIVFTAATKSPNIVPVTMPLAGLLQRFVIFPFMLWVLIFALGLARRR